MTSEQPEMRRLGLGLWDIPQVRILLLGSSDPGSLLWSLRKLPDVHQLIIRQLEPDWQEEVPLPPLSGWRRSVAAGAHDRLARGRWKRSPIEPTGSPRAAVCPRTAQ